MVGNALTGVRYITGPGENAGADAPRSARARRRKAAAAEGSGGSTPTPQGLPFLKPPYGRITAIDMSKGEFIWQVAHGETPDFVRNSPALKGVTIPRTGQSGAFGVLDHQDAGRRRRTGGHDACRDIREARCCAPTTRRRATKSARVLLPAPQSGSPMTYALNGQQFIIVAVSGGNYSGEYIAFTLPEAARR